VNAEISYGQQGATPRRRRGWWVLGGFLLQAIGAGGVAAFLWVKVRREDLGGHITTMMVKLAWHSEVHTRQGLAILIAGAIVYAAGSVVMARPYVTNTATLLLAVPVAAVVGLLVLGVLALIVALIVFLASMNADLPSGGGGAGKAKRKPRAVSAVPPGRGQ
jgi:hypothetical protein